MLKGVSHRIIEVNDTGSRYFERAILIVRPEYLNEDDAAISSDARRVLSGFGQPPTSKNSDAHKAACQDISMEKPGHTRLLKKQRRLRPGVKRALIFLASLAAVMATWLIFKAL